MKEATRAGCVAVIITARPLPVNLPSAFECHVAAVYYNHSGKAIADTKVRQLEHARATFSPETTSLRSCALLDDDRENVNAVSRAGGVGVLVCCGTVTPATVRAALSLITQRRSEHAVA
jgi:hypothetical protein